MHDPGPDATSGRLGTSGGWRPSRTDVENVCLTDGALTLVAQPIVDLSGARIVGYEMLSRFSHGTPDLWFAAAAEVGLAGAIDAKVVKQAMALRPHLPPDTFMSINLEPQAVVDPFVREALLDVGSLAGVVIEITEHSRIDDVAELLPSLDELRGAGALVAADDVGAGYAGLQALLELRPQIVKIDRSLIDGLDRSRAKLAMVKMLGEVANQMDAWVLAEGIEREEELVELLRLEVPLAQGYLLARPAAELITQLPPRIAAVVGGQASVRRTHVVAALMDGVPLVDADQPLRRATDTVVVRVDTNGRPTAIEWHGTTVPKPLTTHLHEDLADLALRVSAVDGALHPVVVVDATGRAVGVVHPARLMAHLAAPGQTVLPD